MSIIEKEYNPAWKHIYNLLQYVGICSIIAGVYMITHTMINLYIPILIILGSSFIGFIISHKHFNYFFPYNKILTFIYFIITWGFISVTIFMSFNYLLKSTDSTFVRLKIKEKFTVSSKQNKVEGRKRVAVVTFEYLGFEKEQQFSGTPIETVYKCDSVDIEIKKGALGFPIFQNLKLVEK